MDDEMDSYLSRNLKNWATGQKPPAGGRARLLEAAAYPPVPVYYYSPVRHLWHRLINTPAFSRQHEDGWLEPITQSRMWSFHLTSMRLVA